MTASWLQLTIIVIIILFIINFLFFKIYIIVLIMNGKITVHLFYLSSHVCPQAVETCVAAAGFSVGEFAALVFSGAINFTEGKYDIISCRVQDSE